MKKIDLSKLDIRVLRALTKSNVLDDFLKYVHKYEVELTDEEATEAFNILKSDITELTEEQLELVSGGVSTCQTRPGNHRLIP